MGSESSGTETEESEDGEEAGEEEQEPIWPEHPDDHVRRPMEETATFISFAKRFNILSSHCSVILLLLSAGSST